MVKTKKGFRSLNLVFLSLLIIESIFAGYNLLFWSKIYPGVYISGISVGGKSKEAAENLLKQSLTKPEKIYLSYENQNFELPLNDIDFNYNFSESVQEAYRLDRSGNFFQDAKNRLLSPLRKEDLNLKINLNEEKLDKNLSIIAGLVTQDPVLPSISFEGGKPKIERGKAGTELDTNSLKQIIYSTLIKGSANKIQIPVTVTNNVLTDDQIAQAEERVEKLIKKRLILNFEFRSFNYTNQDLVKLITPGAEFDKEEVSALSTKIGGILNREPQNPTFVFEEGKVKEFSPAKFGVKVSETSLSDLILESLSSLEKSDLVESVIEIPAEKAPPAISTSDVNNLGIKEQIGYGISYFKGSIPSRVHNIKTASARLNGVLVPPGEIFSFNGSVGDISSLTGFQQAYIIKDGRTILGDGGGVCQVSTTLFRSVLNTGLPITERYAHAYRVGYYEQSSPPGLDATVYSPTTDFKFKNDTPGHILIQTKVDTKNSSLTFELYGTSDGRVSTITKPSVTSVVAPPPDLYQDDPSLGPGIIKQIEHRANGAKVVFKYLVERDGEVIIDRSFTSNYRPWQAVYLKGI